MELSLDHLASHIYSLGSSVISGEGWNYSQLASDDLAELEEIRSELESCGLQESEMEPFRTYITATQDLLQELIKLGSGG
jgi:hypothetical protein